MLLIHPKKYTILYKKILVMAIKTFRVPVSTTAGTDIIDSTPEIKRIADDGAVLLGTSSAIPLADGTLLLGTWQQVVVCDFDNRPSTRDSIVQLHLPS